MRLMCLCTESSFEVWKREYVGMEVSCADLTRINDGEYLNQSACT